MHRTAHYLFACALAAALLHAQNAPSALPKGVSKLRIAMSVNQVGSGYLAAFSHVVSVRKK